MICEDDLRRLLLAAVRLVAVEDIREVGQPVGERGGRPLLRLLVAVVVLDERFRDVLPHCHWRRLRPSRNDRLPREELLGYSVVS